MRAFTVSTVIAVVLTSLPACAGPDDLGALSAASPSPPASPSSPNVSPSVRGRLIFLDLHGPEHGFAIVGDCVTQPAYRCRQRVAVLEPGRGWQQRSSPLPDLVSPTAGFGADLRVLGPGRAVIWDPPDSLNRTTRWRQWFTDDGGVTWRSVGVRADRPATVIPPGGRLITDHVNPADPHSRWRVLVLDPATGERRLLASQPALDQPRAGHGLPQGDAGHWWITGKDPRTGDPAVAVSRDAGRSWTTSRLSASPKARGTDVVAGHGTMYALVSGELPLSEQAQNGLLAIHRSSDDGQHWERVWSYRAGVAPRSVVGAVADAEGGLRVLSEDGSSHRSLDGGRTFTPSASPGGALVVTRAGYVLTADGMSNLDETRYRFSRDGLTWRTVTVSR